MNTAAELKKQARAEAKERLSALSPADFRGIGTRIAERVLADTWYREADCLFCFAGTGAEIDTRVILRTALTDGKILCVPKCSPGGVMTARRITAPDELRPGKFGIPEPGDGAEIVEKKRIGLILVPCLAAAPGGLRLGRGGGYYDRYLSDYHGRTMLLCPRALLMETLPTDANDIRIDRIMTEDGEVTG